jgi:hypothetical protein
VKNKIDKNKIVSQELLGLTAKDKTSCQVSSIVFFTHSNKTKWGPEV